MSYVYDIYDIQIYTIYILSVCAVNHLYSAKHIEYIQSLNYTKISSHLQSRIAPQELGVPQKIIQKSSQEQWRHHHRCLRRRDVHIPNNCHPRCSRNPMECTCKEFKKSFKGHVTLNVYLCVNRKIWCLWVLSDIISIFVGGKGRGYRDSLQDIFESMSLCEEMKNQLNLEVTDVFQPHKKGSELVDHLSLFLPGRFGH